jgi:hypothetical protein
MKGSAVSSGKEDMLATTHGANVSSMFSLAVSVSQCLEVTCSSKTFLNLVFTALVLWPFN